MAKALFPVLIILSLLIPGCEDTNMGIAIEAGKDAYQAATLTDEEVQRLAIGVARIWSHRLTTPTRSGFSG